MYFVSRTLTRSGHLKANVIVRQILGTGRLRSRAAPRCDPVLAVHPDFSIRVKVTNIITSATCALFLFLNMISSSATFVPSAWDDFASYCSANVFHVPLAALILVNHLVQSDTTEAQNHSRVARPFPVDQHAECANCYLGTA